MREADQQRDEAAWREQVESLKRQLVITDRQLTAGLQTSNSTQVFTYSSVYCCVVAVAVVVVVVVVDVVVGV